VFNFAWATNFMVLVIAATDLIELRRRFTKNKKLNDIFELWINFPGYSNEIIKNNGCDAQ
jgi:hypothetical protein